MIRVDAIESFRKKKKIFNKRNDFSFNKKMIQQYLVF